MQKKESEREEEWIVSRDMIRKRDSAQAIPSESTPFELRESSRFKSALCEFLMSERQRRKERRVSD